MSPGGSCVNVDAYPFLAFSDLTCHCEDTENRCFLDALCCLIVKRLNLEVATKRLLHQQVKIPGDFWCHVAHGSVSLHLFLVVWIFLRYLGVIWYDR